MKYNIRVEQVDGDRYGAEIQPPISDKAFDGIAKALTTAAWAGHSIAADAVYMTRNDTEGTAFIIDTSPDDPKGLRGYLATQIGCLIDPCSVHEISRVPEEE